MNFPEILDTLLKERGIDKSDKDEFLKPSYGKLHDPLLLPNMERARDRVIGAIEKNEHIVVFSDYDADGIPGAVVLSDFFKRANYDNVSFYIPHRHDEGFGLNMSAIDEVKSRGATLMITVDCGTVDIEEIDHATSLGIDVIVTDHHESHELPKAYAVVNPKIKGSKYPWKELCGSGVVYKLVQAILLKNRFGIKEGMEKWSLDMVGIATLSDMVSLRDENRILAKFGLEVLRKSPRPGLLALYKKLNMDPKYITEDDIAFMITPRINAASRMGVPLDAFKLLSTTDQVEAEKYALHLEKINNERKGIVAAVVKDAKKHLAMREMMREVIVIGNPEWRPSLLGLVANSLVEEYARPVFVWGRDGDGVIKGSCRSYNGYDLFTLMSSAEGAFIEFGGHAGAGGFSVTLEQVTVLEDKLSEIFSASEKVLEKEKVKAIPIKISDVSEELWQTVSLFAPFGMDNPKPIFELKGEIKSAREFGKEGNHLEIILEEGSLPRHGGVKCISFFSSLESYGTKLEPGLPVTVLATLEKSYFLNRPELRLRIVDVRN
jgi:single-stranded-DNA-specific exonuclease